MCDECEVRAIGGASAGRVGAASARPPARHRAGPCGGGAAPAWRWCWLVALQVLLATAPVAADQRDHRLDPLFSALATAPDASVAGALERRIWAIWALSGDPQVDALLQAGTRAMAAGDAGNAVRLFDAVIDRAPGFAEGWNKRATAHFLRGNLAASVHDIGRTLALEPRHFGALSGLGLIFLRRGEPRRALAAFEAVLEIHPRSPSALTHVERLRAALSPPAA